MRTASSTAVVSGVPSGVENSSRATPQTPRWLITGTTVWALILVVGSILMVRHEFGASAANAQPARWPSTTGLDRRPGQPTLVMAMHPECPCSRASLDQLERVIAASRTRLEIFLLFFDTPGQTASRQRSTTWKRAIANPAIRAIVDSEGRLAQRFGATTSGEVLFYDASDRLQFHGGLTPSRGESARGVGVDAILAVLANHQTFPTAAPAFGCPVEDFY